jgi:hypothetical protein
MKKIITGACILLVTVMVSPAMAQDGPNGRLDRQGDRINQQIDRRGGRYGDRRIDRVKDHWRGQGSTRFANPRGHRGNHMHTRRNNRHQRHIYSRYNNGHRRHMYSRFYNRYQRHTYSMYNHGHYRHRNSW